MPTLKPKRTFVYSSEDCRRAIEAALADRVELHRNNMSSEIEDILVRALIPSEDYAQSRVLRIYYGMSNVQSELAATFRDNAAGIEWRARHQNLRPLVEMASQQSAYLTLDCTRDETYHLVSCWDSVCNELERALDAAREAGDAQAAAALTLDVMEARNELWGQLKAGQDDRKTRPEAGRFFDVVLREWARLGDYTFTYRALMDVVTIAQKWPNDARTREAFKDTLSAVAAEWAE